jgi:protein SCO1/2
MGSFDPRITALTGTAADIARAARAFDAFYEKTAGSGQGYTFDHTTNVYLVGRDGRIGATANLQTPEADRQKMLAALLAQH